MEKWLNYGIGTIQCIKCLLVSDDDHIDDPKLREAVSTTSWNASAPASIDPALFSNFAYSYLMIPDNWRFAWMGMLIGTTRNIGQFDCPDWIARWTVFPWKHARLIFLDLSLFMNMPFFTMHTMDLSPGRLFSVKLIEIKHEDHNNRRTIVKFQ